MKFCTHCGKELFDEAVICPGCGCATGSATVQTASADLVRKLAEKVKTNGIIWLVIGILQILAGVFANWFVLIVGVLNVVSSVQDMNYSKQLPDNPTGIIQKFEPVTGPVITLVYNLIFGGIIGVVGSIYYFVGIRSFVMENKAAFAD
ncbi:MAG: hypothetical protein E7455_05345 [Ruminococcaceae bacterium]|nr:hypothetical protein [Oscillospiraceae bacterium]